MTDLDALPYLGTSGLRVIAPETTSIASSVIDLGWPTTRDSRTIAGNPIKMRIVLMLVAPEALASYAKMADDDSLRTMADRIQARAVRRMGELLKQFDGRGGDRTKTDGAVSFAPTQTEAARAAGISERQQVTAVRVANVPEEKFEAAIEQPKPATVTHLAEMGKQSRSVPAIGLRQVAHPTNWRQSWKPRRSQRSHRPRHRVRSSDHFSAPPAFVVPQAPPHRCARTRATW